MHRLTVCPELTHSRWVIQIVISLRAVRPELILYKNKICGAVEGTHIFRHVHAFFIIIFFSTVLFRYIKWINGWMGRLNNTYQDTGPCLLWRVAQQALSSWAARISSEARGRNLHPGHDSPE